MPNRQDHNINRDGEPVEENIFGKLLVKDTFPYDNEIFRQRLNKQRLIQPVGLN